MIVSGGMHSVLFGWTQLHDLSHKRSDLFFSAFSLYVSQDYPNKTFLFHFHYFL